MPENATRHRALGLHSGVFVAGMNILSMTGARRIALRMVLGQIVTTFGLAALFLIWRDWHVAASALAGGGIGVAACLAMVAFMFRDAGGDPKRALRNAYKGEAAKLGVTVLLFVAALKFLDVAPLPLFVTYIATLLVHWVALARHKTIDPKTR